MAKMNRREVLAGIGGGAALLVLSPKGALAQDYPRRPITLVIQYAEGGGTDTIMRSLAKALEKQFDVSIRAVNQPGAVGAVATQFVEAKPADGNWLLGGAEYNKFFRVLGHATEAPWMTWQFYKVGTSIPAWGVKPDSPYKSLADVVADAKARPGEVKISNAGIGSVWHEATIVALEDATGAKFTHVPYQGGAPDTLAVLQGEADVVASGVHEQVEYIRGGEVRNLAVFRDAPLEVEGIAEPLTPVTADIPGAADLGILSGVYMVGARRDTPKEILVVLEEAIAKAVEDPEFVALLKSRVLSPEFKTGEAVDREAALFESITSWLYWDQQMPAAKVNPADLGIPRPSEFAAYWPPEGYEPAL